MRARVIVLASVFLAAPALAQAQARDTTVAQPRRNVFFIQPWSANAPGPRLELERAVSRRVTLVAGTRLTLRNPAYAGRNPVFSSVDVGARYYAAGRNFRGPFAGLYAGYDRVVRDYGAQVRQKVPRMFVGATVGYDFVVFKRLIIGPALGAEYGRPSPAAGVQTWEIHPRLGIGFNFE